MNIELKMDITVSPDDLKSILVEYLQQEGFDAKVGDVTFKIDTRCEGYGPNECDVHYFDGCKVRVKRKEI